MLCKKENFMSILKQKSKNYTMQTLIKSNLNQQF